MTLDTRFIHGTKYIRRALENNEKYFIYKQKLEKQEMRYSPGLKSEI